MKPLKNERREKFAQIMALGSSFAAAYKAAGYDGKPQDKLGARLASFANVRARIDFLKAKAAEETVVTLESLMRDAMRCRDLGIQHGQINAAVLAVKELGILTGLRVERRETRRIDPATISDEELAAIIRAGPPIEGELEAPRRRIEPPAERPDERQPVPSVGSEVGSEGLEPAALKRKANGKSTT